MKGILNMSKFTFESREFDPELGHTVLDRLQFKPFHFLIIDDMFVWKVKPNTNEVTGRLYFTSIANIGVISAKNIFFFTFGKDLYHLKTENEWDLKRWIKSVIFMTEECSKQNQPVKFEQFSCIDVENEFDELFDKDEISYDYESIKFKKKQEKQLKAFDTKNINIVDEKDEKDKLNRSVDELSVDSDDSDGPPPPKKGGKPAPVVKKAEVKKPAPEPAKPKPQEGEEGGFLSKWLGFA